MRVCTPLSLGGSTGYVWQPHVMGRSRTIRDAARPRDRMSQMAAPGVPAAAKPAKPGECTLSAPGSAAGPHAQESRESPSVGLAAGARSSSVALEGAVRTRRPASRWAWAWAWAWRLRSTNAWIRAQQTTLLDAKPRPSKARRRRCKCWIHPPARSVAITLGARPAFGPNCRPCGSTTCGTPGPAGTGRHDVAGAGPPWP